MTKIGEVGCGNGSFIKKIGSIAQKAKFYCYDNEQKILDLAVDMDKRFELKTGSIEDVTENLEVLFLRLVLHQVQNRENFIKKTAEILPSGSKLVIVDTYDKNFILCPTMPLFTNSLQNHRKTMSSGSATRDLRDEIIQICGTNNLQLQNENLYSVPSSLDGYKEQFRDYMSETANIFGSNNEIDNEIMSWYVSDYSHAQIGLFACSFVKS